MADGHTKEQRSYNMSRIRGSNTALELSFFALLDGAGIAYEKHPKLFGRPDCLIGSKIIIFVDGDFWHGYQFDQWKSRLTSEYWIPKIESNIKRDRKKRRILRKEGYIVLRIWGHSVKASPRRVLRRVLDAIKRVNDGNLVQ